MARTFRYYFFKTSSGQIVPASSFSFLFVDRQLENDYVCYLAETHFDTFRWISICAVFWAFIFGLFYYASDVWVFTMIFPILSACILGSASIFAAQKVIRSSEYRLYLEYFYSVMDVFYVEMFAIVQLLINRKYSVEIEKGYSDKHHFNYLWIESLAVITVTFACLFRRRLPFVLLSNAIIVFVDIITASYIANYQFAKIMEVRCPALLAAFLTSGVHVYQREIAERSEFLSRRELENWKINVDDVKVLEVLGRGSYGQVFRGVLKNYEVAVKMVNIEEKKLKLPEAEIAPSSFLGSCFRFMKHLKWRPRNNRDREKEKADERHELIASESNLDEFEREIRLMYKLRHPNIVTFMGACLQRPKLLLILEYCVHGSLFDLLVDVKRKDIMTCKFKIETALGCAHALQYLHSRRPLILHRDFKSPNVLLDRNYNVKICDFGLSDSYFFQRQEGLTENGDSKKLIESRSSPKIVGTTPWLAPEVFQGDAHSIQSDVYSFGIVLWEMSSERHPYEEDFRSTSAGVKPKHTIPSLVKAIVKKDYRPRIQACPDETHQCPHDFIELFKRCWDKNPHSRPSWDVIIAKLTGILEMNHFANEMKGKNSSNSLDTYVEITDSRVPVPDKTPPVIIDVNQAFMSICNDSNHNSHRKINSNHGFSGRDLVNTAVEQYIEPSSSEPFYTKKVDATFLSKVIEDGE